MVRFLPLPLVASEEFDRILLETVDHVLRVVFGESAIKTICESLNEPKELRREIIPSHFGEFSYRLNYGSICQDKEF